MKFTDMSENAPKRDLTPKQAAFVREYLIDLNATQAAIRAGYSAKTAQAIAAENLSKPLVKAAVQAEMDKRAQKTGITAADVIESIARIRQKAEDAGDFSNALKGNELLGKHLKLFTDKVEHAGSVVIQVATGVPESPEDKGA